MNVRIASRWLSRPITSPPTLLSQIRHKSWFGFGKDEPPAEPVESPEPDLADLEPKRGDLTSSSLFEGVSDAPIINPLLRDPERNKWTWLKRADEREHRRRGRLTKKEMILRTEKAHTAKSHFMKTSVKKLGPLARQIAGKNIEDAIVQMRFSAKRAAGDVMAHLKHARAEALLRRDMDPKVTYIEQAWVGRGEYGQAWNHRAKGRIDRLRLPYTSLLSCLFGFWLFTGY